MQDRVERIAGHDGRDLAAIQPSTLRTWTINGDFVGLAGDGVQRYAREVTQALDGLSADGHELARGLKLQLVVPQSVVGMALRATKVVVVPEFSKPRLPQVWCQVQLPRHVEGGLLSFCNLAPVAIAKQIVCIHDMQTRLHPQSYGFGFRLAHRVILPMLGRRCVGITTVSEQSRDDIVRLGVADRDRVHVTWNGADHARRWQAEPAGVIRGDRRYVFGYARGQAHKNVELFWKLAPLLEDAGIDVVLSGTLSEADLMRLGPVPSNVRLVGRLSDNEVAAALDGALAYLLPSRTEGFGLPLVEAMVRGCPVLASDVATLRSVGGEGALYFNPDDAAGWAQGVAAMRDDKEARGALLAAGVLRAAEFSWRRIGERYLELMARADGLLLSKSGAGR